MTLNDLLPDGFSVETVIVVMAGLAAAATTLAVWQTLVVRDPLAPRIKALAARRAVLRSELIGGTAGRGNEASVQLSLMRRLVQKLNLVRSQTGVNAAVKLSQAGMRSKDALIVYLFCRFCLPFAAGAISLISIQWLHIFKMSDMVGLLVSISSVLVGMMAPGIFISNAISKRRAALQKGLPDGLDLLVICAEAGLSLDSALTRVAREIGASAPELADELGLTAVELTFLPERQKALENLNQRTNMPGIRGVVNTLHQSEKYGTPLAQSLRVLAAEFRDDRLMRAEEKAARLPAILTVPMIIFILPTLFIVLIGPAIMTTIDALRGMQ